MTRILALGVVLSMMAATSAVEAQLGGLIRKKAAEVIGKKPEPAKPAPAPAPDAAVPDAAVPETAVPASPAATPVAAPAPVKPTGSVLDASALPVRDAAVQVLRGRVNRRPNGDWDQLPYIPTAAATAAYALGDSARAALVETVGLALKSLVNSAAFVTEHAAFVKNEHRGADHGLKGVVTIEDAMKRNDFKAIEAMQAREMVAIGVDQARSMPAEDLKRQLLQELPRWRTRAAEPKRSDRIKFQKMVAVAEPIEALAATDEQFLRGYAVIRSIDVGGPDTADAVFATHARVKQEKEQAAYDSHNLAGQLKQQLTTFVAIASKVNFDAPTVQKGGQTLFVNPADERQGALWKACFRAGEASTAAALKLARAWLAEL